MNEKHLLVIEDDPHTADVLEILIADWTGYRARVARTINEAKLLLIREKPDVVLLDFWLGTTHTAKDVISFIQDNWVPKDRPRIILMSVDRRMGTHAHELEADAFLLKPFTIEELVALVQ